MKKPKNNSPAPAEEEEKAATEPAVVSAPEASPNDAEPATDVAAEKPVPDDTQQSEEKEKPARKTSAKFSFRGLRKRSAKSDNAARAEAREAGAPAGRASATHAKGFKAFLTSINYIGMGKQRGMFIQSLATMLNAGLSLVDALDTLVLEMRSKPMKKLVKRIRDSVESGTPLWRAMEDQYFFSPYELALVRIGEEAGSLSQNMEYLAEQQEKDRALRAKVKMAMIYPTIVLTLMFIIVMALGMFVLPNLIQVLFSLNVELPLSTRIVVKISSMFEEHGAVFVPGLIGLFILTGLLSKYTRFKAVTQWCMFRIPGIGRLAREATIARFGVILGGLLQAGVPLVEALRSLVEVTPIVSYKNFYAKLLDHILIGDSFSKAFQALPQCKRLLPISVQQLIVTGEKSGALSSILLKITDIYEKKAEETAEKLPTILEPMLLLFIGGLVGGIAFSVIVPIYSVVGNVG